MRLARSNLYYQPRAKSHEADLKGRIEAICLEFPGYGYRKATEQLKRDSTRVNHKRVLRMMKESDFVCRVKRKWVKTTDSRHPFRRYPNLVKGMIISRLNQVWLSDITYICIRMDSFTWRLFWMPALAVWLNMLCLLTWMLG